MGKFDNAFELKNGKMHLSLRTLAQLTREDIEAIRKHVEAEVSGRFHFTVSKESNDIIPMQLIMTPFAPERRPGRLPRQSAAARELHVALPVWLHLYGGGSDAVLHEGRFGGTPHHQHSGTGLVRRSLERARVPSVAAGAHRA